MQSTRVLAIAIVGLCVGFKTGAARADDLVATKNGLICRSADALSELTLRDGSSRAGSPSARRGDQALKQSGGCFDVSPGLRVSATSIRKNTAIVRYNPGYPIGQQTFYVATIDFQRVNDGPAPSDVGAPSDLAPTVAASPTPSNGSLSNPGPDTGFRVSPTPTISSNANNPFEATELTPTLVAFAYGKLLGLPPDFTAMAKNTPSYQSGSVFERDAKATRVANLLRAQYASFDPNAKYVLNTNESLNQYDPQAHAYQLGQGPSEYWSFVDPSDPNRQEQYHLQFDDLDQFGAIPFSDAASAEHFADRFHLDKTNQFLGGFRTLIVLQFVRASPADSGSIRDMVGHVVAMRVFGFGNSVMHDFGSAPDESADARGSSSGSLKAADLQAAYVGMTMSDFETTASTTYAKMIGSADNGVIMTFRDYSSAQDATGCGSITYGAPDFGANAPPSLSAGFSACLAAKVDDVATVDMKLRPAAAVSTISSMQLLDSMDPAAILRSLRSKYGPETDLKSPYDIVWIGRDPKHPGTKVQIEAVIKTVVNTDPPKADLEVTVSKIVPKEPGPTPVQGASAPAL